MLFVKEALRCFVPILTCLRDTLQTSSLKSSTPVCPIRSLHGVVMYICMIVLDLIFYSDASAVFFNPDSPLPLKKHASQLWWKMHILF